jgi:hypothetical protein
MRSPANRRSSALGSENFGQHADTTQFAGCSSRHGFQRLVACAGLLHQLGIAVLTRIGGVQSGLVGEDDEGVGFYQIGYQRA